MSARKCNTCGTTHLPPTGRHCKLALEAPLPSDAVEGMESTEEKFTKLKQEIANQEHSVQAMADILELERRLADLSVQRSKLQAERDMIAEQLSGDQQNRDIDLKDSFQQKTSRSQENADSGNVDKHVPMTGPAGFTQPGGKTSSDSSDTGTDSSCDSKASKIKKKKSRSKRRKRLLRLNQYTSTHK